MGTTMKNFWLATQHVPPDAYPEVSIIIPATRVILAEQTLQTLSQQQYDGRIETIVVGPPAEDLAQRWLVIALPPQQPGQSYSPAQARNLGAAHATGEILLFLDDDMLVTKDWVLRNVQELQQPGIGVVGARMPGLTKDFFARCVDFTHCGHYQHGYFEDRAVGSGSMGIHASIFHRLGGFDESLHANEDIDLCYRVQTLGYRTVYQPEIVALHNHSYNTLSTLLRYNYRHGLASGLTTKIRHRNSTLKHHLFYRIRAPLFFLLLLPLVALAASIRIVYLNVAERWSVLCYAPFILLGKLAYEYGVFVRLLKGEEG